MTKNELNNTAHEMVATYSSRKILDALAFAAEHQATETLGLRPEIRARLMQRARQFAHMADTAKRAGL